MQMIRVVTKPQISLSYLSETVRDKIVADFTKRYLVEALTRNQGNVSAAARDSGIERQHFQKLMRKFGLRSASFRGDRHFGVAVQPRDAAPHHPLINPKNYC